MSRKDPEELPPGRKLPEIPVKRVKIPTGPDPNSPPPVPREHLHPRHPPLPQGPPAEVEDETPRPPAPIDVPRPPGSPPPREEEESGEEEAANEREGRRRPHSDERRP